MGKRKVCSPTQVKQEPSDSPVKVAATITSTPFALRCDLSSHYSPPTSPTSPIDGSVRRSKRIRAAAQRVAAVKNEDSDSSLVEKPARKPRTRQKVKVEEGGVENVGPAAQTASTGKATPAPTVMSTVMPTVMPTVKIEKKGHPVPSVPVVKTENVPTRNSTPMTPQAIPPTAVKQEPVNPCNHHFDEDEDDNSEDDCDVEISNNTSEVRVMCEHGIDCFWDGCPLGHPENKFCEVGHTCREYYCKFRHSSLRPKRCWYGSRCNKRFGECSFLHPSISTVFRPPEEATVIKRIQPVVNIPCRYGRGCFDSSCIYRHPHRESRSVQPVSFVVADGSDDSDGYSPARSGDDCEEGCECGRDHGSDPDYGNASDSDFRMPPSYHCAGFVDSEDEEEYYIRYLLREEFGRKL